MELTKGHKYYIWEKKGLFVKWERNVNIEEIEKQFKSVNTKLTKGKKEQRSKLQSWVDKWIGKKMLKNQIQTGFKTKTLKKELFQGEKKSQTRERGKF